MSFRLIFTMIHLGENQTVFVFIVKCQNECLTAYTEKVMMDVVLDIIYSRRN